MKILERLKKDKSFRIKAILIAVLIVFIWSKGGEEKKEAQPFETCDQYNTFGFEAGWDWEDGSHHMDGVSGDNIALCIASNCYMAEVPVSGWLNPEVCVPYALNGWIVDDVDACKSGCVSTVNDKTICVACEEGETCNARERSIAKILWSMGVDLSCKTAYYAVLFGGGTMLLFGLMAAL